MTVIGTESFICQSTNITIEFLTEFGDLPAILVNTTLLEDPIDNHATHFLANITTIQDGAFPSFALL